MPAAELRALIETRVEERLGGRFPAALGWRPRTAAETAPTGIPEVDALTGGLPRGALTEIVGPGSSGRTALLLSLLSEFTRRQELCALVDAGDCFDPASAEAAGVELGRLLWVRCEKAARRRQPAAKAKPSATWSELCAPETCCCKRAASGWWRWT